MRYNFQQNAPKELWAKQQISSFDIDISNIPKKRSKKSTCLHPISTWTNVLLLCGFIHVGQATVPLFANILMAIKIIAIKIT
ncbi:hypothetical protein D0T84_08095 [Dysgonomonas sp. 521]|nr:hypothetical protein [Dysgonomonas sp. 521]